MREIVQINVLRARRRLKEDKQRGGDHAVRYVYKSLSPGIQALSVIHMDRPIVFNIPGEFMGAVEPLYWE